MRKVYVFLMSCTQENRSKYPPFLDIPEDWSDSEEAEQFDLKYWKGLEYKDGIFSWICGWTQKKSIAHKFAEQRPKTILKKLELTDDQYDNYLTDLRDDEILFMDVDDCIYDGSDIKTITRTILTTMHEMDYLELYKDIFGENVRGLDTRTFYDPLMLKRKWAEALDAIGYHLLYDLYGLYKDYPDDEDDILSEECEERMAIADDLMGSNVTFYGFPNVIRCINTDFNLFCEYLMEYN